MIDYSWTTEIKRFALKLLEHHSKQPKENGGCGNLLWRRIMPSTLHYLDTGISNLQSIIYKKKAPTPED